MCHFGGSGGGHWPLCVQQKMIEKGRFFLEVATAARDTELFLSLCVFNRLAAAAARQVQINKVAINASINRWAD